MLISSFLFSIYIFTFSIFNQNRYAELYYQQHKQFTQKNKKIQPVYKIRIKPTSAKIIQINYFIFHLTIILS